MRSTRADRRCLGERLHRDGARGRLPLGGDVDKAFDYGVDRLAAAIDMNASQR
jgi:hypothetical protein